MKNISELDATLAHQTELAHFSKIILAYNFLNHLTSFSYVTKSCVLKITEKKAKSNGKVDRLMEKLQIQEEKLLKMLAVIQHDCQMFNTYVHWYLTKKKNIKASVWHGGRTKFNGRNRSKIPQNGVGIVTKFGSVFLATELEKVEKDIQQKGQSNTKLEEGRELV